jgi:hypothetical protein
MPVQLVSVMNFVVSEFSKGALLLPMMPPAPWFSITTTMMCGLPPGGCPACFGGVVNVIALPRITLRPTLASNLTATNSRGANPSNSKLTCSRPLDPATNIAGDRTCDERPAGERITNHALVPDTPQSATTPCNTADSGVRAVGRPVTTPGLHREPPPAANGTDPATSSTTKPSAASASPPLQPTSLINNSA